MSAAHTSAPLTRTDIARIWRETTGGVRMSQTDEEFARRVERAAIEAVAADKVLAALKRLMRSDASICAATEDELLDAANDTSADPVVREMAASVLEARAAIAAAQGEQG